MRNTGVVSEVVLPVVRKFGNPFEVLTLVQGVRPQVL